MKNIKDASVLIMKMVGEQCLVPQNAARFATWCIAAATEDNDVLILNVLTKELILLDKSESEFLCLNDLFLSNAESIPGDGLFEFLCKHWYLVPKEHNDKELVDEVRAVVACMSIPEGIVGYTILTTTDCNARCFYCYERNFEKVAMNRQVALDTAEYIKKTAGKKIKLHWFGGEPLFHIPAIDVITAELKRAGVNFVSVLTSNGYLVTDDVIKKAVNSWNLKGIQITLDGTEKVYNHRKAYANSSGSAFQRVIGNIEKLLQAEISVVVRLNLDMKNARDLYDLSDYLADQFASYEKFGVYAFYIFEEKTADALGYSFDDTYGELEKLRSYLLEKGLMRRGKVGNTIKASHCMADKDSSIVISPSGELFKCEHIGLTKNCGTIYTGVCDQEIVEYWKSPPKDGAICERCPLHPDCARIAACPDDFAFCPQVIYEDKINRVKSAMLHTYETRNTENEFAEELFEKTC